MTYPHIKTDDIAPPIDIRLVPAAALTAAVCFLMPALPMTWVQRIPVLLLVTGALYTMIMIMIRPHRKRRIFHLVVMLSIACWAATPAAFAVQHQTIAAEKSGWLDFVGEQGTAKMSVAIVTDSVARDSPFGTNWFVTADVEHFGQELTETKHPAKIVISADERWSDVIADDQVCFIGRITEAEATVFVQALTPPERGTCAEGPTEEKTSGRDVLRATLREQAANTVSYAPELLPGLILGDRSQQSEQLDQAMKVSGLSHLSAVSGAHTSLIASAATVLFRSLRMPRSVVIAAFLCTLFLFVHIVGMQPSIIRAATMGAIGAWAVFFGRGSQALPLLALSTIVILTASPELINEAGFQLSVAATAGIVLGAQPLERWLRPFFDKFLPDFWASLFSSSLAISTTAQLACQPVLLTFIDYVSLYSVIANLFATPLLPLITIPGTVAAAISVISPYLSQLLLHMVSFPAAGIGWIATTATNLPGSMLPWPGGSTGIWLVCLHWSASGIVLMKLLRRQRRPKPPVKVDSNLSRWTRLVVTVNKNTTFHNTVQYLVVLVAVVAHTAVFWPTRPASITPDWDVIGCDVGQGDMFLVRTGPESAMVIDTGEDEAIAQQCLKQAQITQVDVLVITHLHADHVGGVQGVLAHAEPEQIIFSTSTDPKYTPETTDLPATAQQVDQSAVYIIDHARHDDLHPVEIRWTILSANSQAHHENDASIVLLAEIYRHGDVVNALFTGDLEEDEARRLLDRGGIPDAIDILKLSHHGAKNGGVEIIEHTSPTMALIGVGADNTYGHPHKDILEALGPHVTERRTDLDGTFAVTFQPSHDPTTMKR